MIKNTYAIHVKSGLKNTHDSDIVKLGTVVTVLIVKSNIKEKKRS